MITNKDEHDYALCLNEDGTITSVHRNKLVKYCKQNIVEFILIPMDDVRQYVLYQNPIKKFSELHLTFDTYMTSYDPKGIMDGEDLPIYEKIHSYDIICEDMFDFAKFIQSMTMLYTIPDRFSINEDEFMNSFTINIESAYINYVRTDSKLISERLKDVDGTVRSSYSIPEFISAIEFAVCGNRRSQYMMHPDDLDDKVIVVDVISSKWTLEEIDVDKPDTIGPSLMLPNHLFGVFSALTSTIAFVPYEHIITLALTHTFDIELCAITEKDYMDTNRTLSEYLCEEVGYDTAETQMSVCSIEDGDLSEYLEFFYDANGLVFKITDFIMMMLNCERILSIYHMHNKVIYGELIKYVVFQASAQISDKKDSLYSFICEDIEMIQNNPNSFYDRFMQETKELSAGIIPERFVGCSMKLLRTTPNKLPF